MNKSARTFIAVKIKPEEELLRVMAILKETLGDEEMKWVDTNNLHLTLKFLGNTTPFQMDEVKRLLISSTANHPIFQLSLSGVGFFRSKGQPRVLFARVQDFLPLELLFSEIDNKLNDMGFESEQREFKPHLTLARIKHIQNKRSFYGVINKLKNTNLQKSTISEVVYFKSNLTPQGPVYEELFKSKLKK